MKKGFSLYSFTGAVLLYLSCGYSHGEEMDLFELPLSELLKLEVTVASHKPELISTTPAIVSRYEMDQMEKMGLRTLKEVLSFVPGVLVQDHLFGQPFVSIRGVYEGFNQKVLFLLDDVPYFMSSHSDIPLLGIPVASISHIEIIRGPGAVYYGTNATAGVIKVITKKESNKQVATLSAGENHLINGSTFNHFSNGYHRLQIGLEYQETDGHKARYPAYSDANSNYQEGTVRRPEETLSALAKYQYQNFQLSAQAFESTYTGLAQPTRQINNVNELTYKGSLIATSYQWQLQQTDIKAFADYNKMYLDFYIQDFAGVGNPGGFAMENEGEDNYRARVGINLSTQLTNSLELFAGAESEQRSTESYQIVNHAADSVLGTIMPSFDVEEHSAYAQLDYQFTDALRFLIGGRYTSNEITGDDTVPRVAAVYQLNKRSSLKFLYSVGFNSPSFTQLKADFAPVVEGNPQLTPEKVHTYDFAYHYSTNDLLLVANLFKLKAEDFILSDRSTGTINFFNAQEFSREGAELDMQYHISDSLHLLANLSYLRHGNSENNHDTTLIFTPTTSFNLGAIYQLGQHSIGTSLRYIGERANNDELRLLNFNYQYQLQQWQLMATLDNALDEEVLHPNMGEFNERPIPGGEGRNLNVSIRYNY